MIVEKSFPRGGVLARGSKNPTKEKENVIFGALSTKTKKLKRNKDIAPEELLEEHQKDTIESHSAELLNYETIQDGMNIMGVVSVVDQLFLTVSLPGRMVARISALEISETYTKAAREFLENTSNSKNYKSLLDLYEVGQVVYGRVVEVKQNKKFARPEILMTLKPSEVHAELMHTNIRKGFIFNGAIAEIQEHGYVVESGIKGLRSFLPLEKSEEGLTLGQLVYMKVHKITIDATASTCICKQLQANQLKVKSLQSEANIDYILPSSIVNFQVSKCLKDGLQGTIMNETFTAYVNEHQLSEPLMLPEDYEIKSKYDARILYIMPLTKFVYLTMNLQNRTTKSGLDDGNLQTFKRGDIIEDAKVHHIGTGGVILILKNQFKGIISYKSIKANYKGNYDQDELLNKYAKKSKHKVRVLDYSFMDSMYICSDDVNVVEEKYFSLNDLKPGDFTTAVIKSLHTAVGGYNVAVGKVKGIMENIYIAPGSKQYELNTKIRCRVVNLNLERNVVYLTNRPEYMVKNCKLLTSLEAAKKNETFTGTIVKTTAEYYLVKFFNGITGILFKKQLVDPILTQQNVKLMEGQTMLFRILSKNGTKLTLGLLEDATELGEICSATVTHVLESGLELNVVLEAENEEDKEISNDRVVKGIVPVQLLSDYLDLLTAKSRIYPVNTKLKTVAIHKNIFSVRDLSYFQEFGVKDWKTIAVGDILRALIQNVNGDVVDLFVPIRGYRKLVKIHIDMLLLQAYKISHIEFYPEQVIYVRVTGKEEATKTISVTAKLTNVWDQQLSSTACYVERYLSEVAEIQKALKKLQSPISNISIGDKVSFVFQGIDADTQDWQYLEEKFKIRGVAKASIIAGSKIKPPKINTKQEAIVIWIDYSNQLIYISPRPADVKHISNSTKLSEEFSSAQQVNAKVLLKLSQIFICSLKKGPNPLVFCPTKLHYNDFENSACVEVKEGDFCKIAFIHKSKPIAVLQRTWNLWQNTSNKKRKNSLSENGPHAKHCRMDVKIEDSEKSDSKVKKAKILNDESTASIVKISKLQLCEEKPTIVGTQKKVKLDKKVEVKETKESQRSSSNMFFYKDTMPHVPKTKVTTPMTLPGVTGFWTTDLDQLNNVKDEYESSDDSDNDNNDAATDDNKQKKKKLSAVEKFKKQREEEARLREIEEKYADPNHMPETIDQFDRLVLSDPNNSKNWINYMVFHLQSAEIDKARAVARRAMKAISMRNSDDLLNIWVALLNLEIRYGSRESFDNTFKEALIYNEPIKIYLRVAEILREAKKQELLEMVGIITKKFKGSQEAWKTAADAYFSVGMSEKAQQMLPKSLASLPEREHVNTIVMFANLNHRHGCKEMAHTLLDQVITSYPKRVDVWAQYIDMLAKDELVDSARCLLERAIIQKIPMKKMRTIFKKYLEFEERYGTESDVEKVKRLAANYVKQNTNTVNV